MDDLPTVESPSMMMRNWYCHSVRSMTSVGWRRSYHTRAPQPRLTKSPISVLRCGIVFLLEVQCKFSIYASSVRRLKSMAVMYNAPESQVWVIISCRAAELVKGRNLPVLMCFIIVACLYLLEGVVWERSRISLDCQRERPSQLHIRTSPVFPVESSPLHYSYHVSSERNYLDLEKYIAAIKCTLPLRWCSCVVKYILRL